MREKYESLSLSVLKDLAKARGMKRISNLKKADLIDRMVEQDELDAQADSAARNERDAGKEQAEEDKADVGQQAARQPEVGQAEEQPEDVKNIEVHQPTMLQPEETQQAEVPYVKAKQTEDALQEVRKNEPDRRKQENWGRKPQKRGDSQQRDEPRQRADSQQRDESRQRADFQQRNTRSPKPRQDESRGGSNRPASQHGAEQEDRFRTVDDRTAQKMESEGITMAELDSGERAEGILEVMPDGYGFIRCENYLPGDQDVYVSPSQIRRFRLKTGDVISGNKRLRSQGEKFSALLYISSVNGMNPSLAAQRTPFEDLTPIFPDERLRFETPGGTTAMRIVDLIAPVGKGQRGMIVSQPKAGKTTLLKDIATSVKYNNPEMHLIILLIDERPEEVTDMKEAIMGDNVEVIYSTFDEQPEHHKRVSEMVIERAKRLVEHGRDVMILLDSITRLARAYNLVVSPSGRTLSGGLDPSALYMPKRFFGAARNMREGGSLTILATALVDTGSRMDDVVYEEFKGTGNMELILDRRLSEKRIFPAIDIVKSGTRREDLLLMREEKDAVDIMRRALNGVKADDAVETILRLFLKTRSNRELVRQILARKFF